MIFAADSKSDSFMEAGDWIALIAAIVTIISTIIAIVSTGIALWTARQVLLTQYVQIDRCIETIPSVLRFHGITDEELAEAGVTAKELAYLSSQFLMGSLYERLALRREKGPFQPGHYRYTLCACEATRRAWPLVKRMLTKTNFTDRVDQTVALFETDAGVSPPAHPSKTGS